MAEPSAPSSNLDTPLAAFAHKAVTTLALGGIVALFKFYVDVKADLQLLHAEVQQTNENTTVILQEMNRLHPRQ